MLRDLVRPYRVEEFFANFWEKAALHIDRGDAETRQWICGLASIDDLDALLTSYNSGMHPIESVRIGQSGVMFPLQDYTRKLEGSLAEVDVERVLSLYRDGASIILNWAEKSIEPLSRLCQSMSRDFRTPVHANAYLTPPHSQGFPVHFDVHDVFVLQVAGEKAWDLYESDIELATPRFLEEATRPPSGPARQVRLAAGDVLYIPRGLPHAAKAQTQASLHITFGITAYTWSDAFRDVLSELERDDAAFRRSFGSPLGQAVSQLMLATLTEKLGNSDLFQAHWERMGTTKVEKERSPRGRLAQLFGSRDITLDTRLAICPHPDMTLRNDGPELVVNFGRKSLALPSFARSELQALLDGTATCAADLPFGLDDESKLVLVRRLVDEGLLRTAATTAA